MPKAFFLVKSAGFLLFVYFSYLMLLITLQYIPIDFHVAFLKIKQDEMQWRYYQIAFFVHVYTSIFVLLLGALQFSSRLRSHFRLLHRRVGAGYSTLVLVFAGPSGLIMGYHANGGPWAKTAFCLLSILWIYTTARAWQLARQKNWERHRHFMYRSYALTLSAISLRLFKWMIVGIFHTPPMDTYRWVAWLGWMVNLMIAEWIIYGEVRHKKT